METPNVRLEDTARLVKHQVTRTFRSFRHRNFRLYFSGQFLSLCGTWMQNLAVSWLVYRLTKSPWSLGLVSFASLAPTLIFGLAGGYCADRFDRKKIILVCQSIGLFQSSVLAYLSFSNTVEVWPVLAMVALLGTSNAFDIPARQSLVVNLVDRENMVNAVSLNASMFNGARMIGPAIAGWIVSAFGEGICFAVNSVSYLAVIAAILMLKLERHDKLENRPESLRTFTEGLRFAASNAGVRSALLLVLSMSLFGMQFLMLMPVMASAVLHGQAGLLGALSASAGAGSLIAALILANRGSGENLRVAVGFALFGFAAALAGFANSQFILLSLPLVMLVAFCMTFMLSGCQSMVQLAAPDHLRGKVMSVYMMTFMGAGPIGSLMAGWVARQIGAPHTITVCACICAVVASIYLVLLFAHRLRSAP